ncbi:MLP-like protein 34 [Humulus lupulus]|uniref:MLP-like protein 34 n=1 Tax=Humulus lupulus TaxID=3486 RepID=UPI002B40A29A|nr:MLP-like protein 34 [Humulus lupulus]
MAQIAKMEFKFEIKSSAEGFYNIFMSKPFLFPKICPSLVKDFQQVEGGWGSVGSVRKWVYISPGSSSCETHTEKIEALDEKSKSVSCKMVEGSCSKLYKSYKYTIEASEKAKGGCILNTIIEYEKQNEDVPPPTMYADIAFAIYKSIDAHLINS